MSLSFVIIESSIRLAIGIKLAALWGSCSMERFFDNQIELNFSL